MRERILASLKQFVEERPKLRRQHLARRLIVLREQAVVDEYLDIVPVEPQFSCEFSFGCQTLESAQRGESSLSQTIEVRAIERSLAIVANAQAIIRIVHAVVRLVANQDDAGTFR